MRPILLCLVLFGVATGCDSSDTGTAGDGRRSVAFVGLPDTLRVDLPE